ncbi:MAG: O-antigen ligase family protein [Phormidesmis sp.]
MALISSYRLTASRPSGWARTLGWLAIPVLLLVGVGFSAVFIEQPIYGVGLVVAIASLFAFLRSFEQTVLGILFLRSALDFYSSYQVPAMFAIGVNLLVLLYVGRQLILRRPVHTDRFWWLLLGWVLLQGLWVALLPTGALGGTAFMAYEALREWVRFFSLVMVYLLTMQLRDRIPPDRLASLLLISLIVPMFFALLQSLPVDLPGFLQTNVGWQESLESAADNRVNSTLGHYNSFATFSLLFLALALWRTQMSRQPLGWVLLVGGLLFCLVATKSLTGLVMMMVYVGLYFLPKIKGKGVFGAIALAIVLAILLSSDLAQSRLAELNQTPLLNDNLSVSRAMALQAANVTEFRNSFNWRLLQWRDLLYNWQQHPVLGYGLASSKKLSVFNTTSHNDYIRFLVEEGVVGLSLFLLFLMAQVLRTLQVMRKSLPGSPQRALSQTLFPFSIAMLVGMAAGNVMVHTATFFYWWVLLAVLDWPWPRQFGGRLPQMSQPEPYLPEPYLPSPSLLAPSLLAHSPPAHDALDGETSDEFSDDSPYKWPDE